MKCIATNAGALFTLAASTHASAADAALFTSAALPELRPSWEWVAGAAVVGLIVGFMFGWRVLDRRIRKKYGGLKIY